MVEAINEKGTHLKVLSMLMVSCDELDKNVLNSIGVIYCQLMKLNECNVVILMGINADVYGIIDSK